MFNKTYILIYDTSSGKILNMYWIRLDTIWWIDLIRNISCICLVYMCSILTAAAEFMADTTASGYFVRSTHAKKCFVCRTFYINTLLPFNPSTVTLSIFICKIMNKRSLTKGTRRHYFHDNQQLKRHSVLIMWNSTLFISIHDHCNSYIPSHQKMCPVI